MICRFINADDIEVLSVEQGNMHQYNLYAYCLNNPVSRKDSSGDFSIFTCAVIGGAIGGAFISAASYAINCGIKGEEFSVGKMVGSIVTGAVCGGAAAGIGMIEALSAFKRGILSAGVGLVAGLYTGITSNSFWDGLVASVATTASCFTGSLIDIGELGKASTVFANYCTTLMVGTPYETVSVALQSADNRNNNSSGNTKTAGKNPKKTVTSKSTVNGCRAPRNMTTCEYRKWVLDNGGFW